MTSTAPKFLTVGEYTLCAERGCTSADCWLYVIEPETPSGE